MGLPTPTFPASVDPPISQDADFVLGMRKVYVAYVDNQIRTIESYVLSWGAPNTNVTAAGTTVLPGGVSLVVVAYDTFNGSQTFQANANTKDGYIIQAIDAGLATSALKTVSFTDANGFLFQDPDRPLSDPLSLVATLTLTAPRNLSWRRVTSARRNLTFWSLQ